MIAASDGKAWLERVDPSDEPIVKLLLAGTGAALVSYARGCAVLHGSSVAMGAKGIAIVGSSGSGKSTLAAMLCQRGWAFVSDVMVVVEPATRTLIAQEPRWRLRDESLAALGEEPNHWPIDDDRTRKRALTCTNQQIAASGSLLDLVVVIEPADKMEFLELAPAQGVVALVVNSYIAQRIVPDFSARLLEMAATMQSAGVRVFVMRYPHSWSVFADVDAALRQLLGHLEPPILAAGLPTPTVPEL